MMRTPVLHWAGLLSLAFLLGCSSSPEQDLIGTWKGDTSAIGTAIKAAKLKNDAPEISGSAAIKAARAMGATTLELRKDNSLDFHLGGNIFKGSWTYDKERKELQLDMKSVEIAPVENAPDPKDFKPATWVAHENELGRLEVFMSDSKAYDFFESASKGKKTGLIVLSKD